ncbi:ADP-ribosylglycohydrolase family protein [Phaeobacter gallaeciensis]|uniref:ADP-ribosylglycohydrolase family protein n=2 Tax=Roseobacteraceae TaxID=2854170 RepID=A0A366WSH2_9RHOB|nr:MULTISPECIES: ADP-ribosylglycohydrolase family protein [Roseobacteraceae]MBT3141414.1 ADP-ribosylglycohydrolase family protein [Falsiruegeria litorea]MBT8167444.1 ADP-ribosylglycohydrolase family protein [Falsiruegeria litorea]RBW51012.1 ADP-ribosylglycohydrolase family protein [Phaeobacter gallaeciensis]
MTQNLISRQRNLVIGAMVADAASLGLHWLYDQDRIAQVAPKTAAFHPASLKDYQDVPGYFAHPTKSVGALSQYGEQALVMLRSLAETGQYDKDHYQAAFQAHFGYGGAYVGYIDHPTRDTLDNISRASAADNAPEFLGADDRQLPAISKLPALVALTAGTEGFAEQVTSAIRVTNDCATAISFGTTAADLMRAIVNGGKISDALKEIDVSAPDDVHDALAPLGDMIGQSTCDITRTIGMSCDLAYGVPSVVHTLSIAPSYREAIEQNIYAGGDSCGRAILLGAVMGAVHGVGGQTGIPEDWIEQLTQRDEIIALLDQLFPA